MYHTIDNMIYDADSCEAAICECKRMRKADTTAAIIWIATLIGSILFAIVYYMICNLFGLNETNIIDYAILFMFCVLPGICSAIYMIRKGTFGIFFSVIKKLFVVAFYITLLPFLGYVMFFMACCFLAITLIPSWGIFIIYPIIDIIGLTIKISSLKHTKEAYAQYTPHDAKSLSS